MCYYGCMNNIDIADKPVIMKIPYPNVTFYLFLITEANRENYRMFSKVLENEPLFLRDIAKWCKGHEVRYVTKFEYRADFPLSANLWNLYTYIRFRLSEKITRNS